MVGELKIQFQVSEMTADAILARLFITSLKIEERVILRASDGNLTISELHVLREIGLSNDRIMTQVAKGLKISVSALTIAMNKLEKKGFVERERSTEDRRIVKVHLTEKGIEAFKLHGDFHKDMVENALTALTDEEKKVLLKALTKLDLYFNEEWNHIESDTHYEGDRRKK